MYKLLYSSIYNYMLHSLRCQIGIQKAAAQLNKENKLNKVHDDGSGIPADQH